MVRFFTGFAVRFAVGQQRNEPGRDSGRNAFDSCLLGKRAKASARRERAGNFSLLAQRKVTKRKGFSPTELTGHASDAGIFRQDIPVLSKNGAHPCAPPSGSAGIRRGWLEDEKRKAESGKRKANCLAFASTLERLGKKKAATSSRPFSCFDGA